MNLKHQPWLRSARTDSLFILLPAVLPLVIVWLFPRYFAEQTAVSSLWWVILVLNIDVAHVYSTVFRFYWDQETFRRYKTHLIVIPIVALAGGILLYTLDGMLFWRILAYVAVFHFIRQQFGFMRLYARKEAYQKLYRIIDACAIYGATLYPLVYWHMFYVDQFNWFVKGDFISIPATLAPVTAGLYWVIITTYTVKELYVSVKNRSFNFPKNALIAGTCISWYAGIILFRGDLTFTMLNVVAHGIPYMALVYIYGEKKNKRAFKFPWRTVTVFVLTIATLAYLEEGLWDVFIWNDHPDIFPLTGFTNPAPAPWLAVLIPLLALPQITHYVLDGFIWKVSQEKTVIDQ